MSESSSPQVESQSAPPTKRHIRKKSGTKRQRTGCLTCRQRRKKCDATYPICGHCTRLNLVCKREEPRVVLPDQSTPNESAKVIEESELLPPRRRSSTDVIPRAPDPVDIHTIIDARQGSDRRFLLKYYTQILTGLVSTNHENNSFLSVFIPMAVDSPPLLTSLLAWSSTHLSRFDDSYEVAALEYRSKALLGVASSLSTASSANPDPDATLAACLVLISIEVALGDTTRWYDHLLGAKHIILSAKSSCGTKRLQGQEFFMQTMDGQWLLRNFAYHDVLGSVALDQPPLMRGAYWLHETHDVLDSYVGVGSRILHIISEIGFLGMGSGENLNKSQRILELDTDSDSTIEAEPPSLEEALGDTAKSSDSEFLCQARNLETLLNQWEPPPSSTDALTELAEAYRSSALVYLYRKIRKRFPERWGLLTSKIEAQVSRTVRHIEEVPLQSLPESGLLFPLFIAGGDTMKPDETRTVLTRLKTLLKHRGFGNIQVSVDVLEELWRLKSSCIKGPSGQPVDWIDVLRKNSWNLMLC